LNAAVVAGNTVTIAPGNEWDSATQTNVNIRQNIIDAIEKVAEAVVPNQGSDAYLGFVPDTIVMSTRVMYDLLLNDKFVKIYEQSPLAEKSPVYTGTLERQILGLDARRWVVTPMSVRCRSARPTRTTRVKSGGPTWSGVPRSSWTSRWPSPRSTT
jgi:hypothetical protein